MFLRHSIFPDNQNYLKQNTDARPVSLFARPNLYLKKNESSGKATNKRFRVNASAKYE